MALKYSDSAPNLPGFVDNRRPRRGVKDDIFNQKVDRSKVLARVGSNSLLRTSQTLSRNLPGTLSTTSLPVHSKTREKMQKTSSASIGQLLPAPSGPSALPKFITEDHSKLTFQAYFKEAVRESADECWRVRKLTITYFLVDDTVQMHEVGPDNSGIWGGPFLSRRKLPKANDVTGRDMHWTDFIVGNEFECFSRTFHIYGCDDKTRKYMEKRGIPLSPNTPDEDITDDFSVKRKAFQSRETGADLTVFRGKQMYPMKTHMEALRGRHTRPHGAEKRAFDYEGQVLSIRLVWDDSGRLYGDKRKVYNLKYYLADKTCEVRAIVKANSGVDPFPLFVKRCRLSTSSKNLANSGTIGGPEGSLVEDGSFYTEKDFYVGNTIDIFNRPMTIVDANDDFTRQYYQNVHCRSMDPHPEKFALTVAPNKEWPKREIPPPTGYGNDEDSMGSVRKLRPTQPKRDLAKLNKMAGKTLAFMTRLISKNPSDQGRRFVLRYFLADDTIQVYETVRPNSGLVGGRFLNRMKMKKPDGSWYTQDDLNLNARIFLFTFEFEIIDMNEDTKVYKHTGSDDHMSSTDVGAVVKKLLNKLRSSKNRLSKVFREADEDKNGKLTFGEMKKLLEHLLGDSTLTDSDVAQVMYHFDMMDEDGFIDYEEHAKKVLHTSDSRFESEAGSHYQTVGQGKDTRGVQREKCADYLKILKRSENDLHAANATKRAVYKFVELFEQNSSSLTSTFRKLDNDHSGEFEFEEFKSALAELQMAPNDVDLIARHYFKAAGAHDAGKSSPSISINEFMKQLSNDSVLLIGQHRK